jgi:hypothetical protein
VATDATLRYEEGGILDWTDDGSFEASIIQTVTNSTTLTFQAPRGAFGTTAAAHDGSTTPKRFRYMPRFLSHNINEFATEALDSLWPDIYVVRDSVYTFSSTDFWYQSAAGTQDILEVYQYKTSLTPDEKIQAMRWSNVNLADTTNFTTGLAFRMEGLDSDGGDVHVINTAKVTLGILTSAQVDIVAYEAAALALESEQIKPALRDDPAVFDSATKIQLFRARARHLRSDEKIRLQQYLPKRDEIVFRDRMHYSDDLVESHVTWRD